LASRNFLYVSLALQPHPLYRPDDRDLYLALLLTPWEAVLGASVHVPTLAGTVELTVKPGTTVALFRRVDRVRAH
jgi:curved DNA-binding protein